jgi:hypothetical protein
VIPSLTLPLSPPLALPISPPAFVFLRDLVLYVSAPLTYDHL